MSFSRLSAARRPPQGAAVRFLGRRCVRAVAAIGVAGEMNRQLLARDHVQVGQRAPALVETEPITGEELVRDGEPDVVERHVVHQPPVGTVEERHRREAGGAPERERARQEVQGQAGVDDVLDDEDVAADDRRVEVLQQPDRAGTPAGVGSELEEVDAVRDRQGAGEVGEEDGARLERRDEQRLAARVGTGQLGAQLGDPAPDLVTGQVDLPDRVAFRREQAG